MTLRTLGFRVAVYSLWAGFAVCAGAAVGLPLYGAMHAPGLGVDLATFAGGFFVAWYGIATVLAVAGLLFYLAVQLMDAADHVSWVAGGRKWPYQR